jgi:hypothetical protein
VAKRIRGSRSAHRPGGQAPVRARRGPEPNASSPVPSSTWDADIDEAIGVVVLEETAITIQEGPTSQERPTSMPQARPAKRVKVRADSLEVRVAAEDVYVREDLRRVGVVSAILISALVVAWIVFVVLDVLGLY